jgi:Lrp/AsnC family transcriptional regulator
MASTRNRIDATDRAILSCLQEDAAMPLAQIASRVGLSSTPCWRRVQKLEEAGVIRKRVALLDGAQLNVGVTVFVSVKTSEHNSEWLDSFAAAVAEFPEVVEFYRMSGDIDYLLRVVVPDIAAYDGFYKRLIEKVRLADVSSSFAMEQIKYTTALPLDYA